MVFAKVLANQIFDQKVIVIARDDFVTFGAVSCRVHALWVEFFASTLGETLNYSTAICFESFPFAAPHAISDLGAIANAYCDHRAALMVSRNEGMTKTYNRFHDPDECSEDIVRLRELHAVMDRAVLRAYAASASNEADAAAWNDLADRAEPAFLDESNEDDHTYQGRLFWPSAFRDEVLAHLLALNVERAAAERAAGLAPGMNGKAEDPEWGEEAE